MTFGLNLSFCVKRWVTPELWARVARDELGIDCVQLSFDLVDPMWPDEVLDELAQDVRASAAAYGITVHSAFVGLAHYTYGQLLHPHPSVRRAAETWLERAYRFAAAAGIRRVGGPAGAIAAKPDGSDVETVPEADYADLVARLARLAARAADAGLEELYLEPTPVRREWPWSIDQAERLMRDLRGSAVPWRYCIDWGHATVAPVYGAEASVEPWLTRLGADVGIIHLQQTDGRLDRHWDFTAAGLVDPGAARDLHRRAGLGQTPVFLEVFYPFESSDREVLEGMRRSCALLKPVFAVEVAG